VTQQYGDYDVESFLGKGSIGKVFLARHRRIGRRVALKTVILEQKFEDDEDRTEFYKRLQREAELCAAMQHPNVVTLYDVGYDGEVVSYLATEYVDGESLLARLKRTRPLPLDEALSISSDVLRGLAYAHSKGIIHRDIKPANILLTSEGQAKIADFGVARPLHSSLTATRSLVGTPNYMSPEQVKTAPVSPRSDLFSAGVVMYELLTGVKPFASTELSGILYNVVNHEPVIASAVNPNVPEPVARVVAKLLQKSPDARPPTASEALAELDSARAGRPFARTSDAETIAIAPDDATTPLPTVIDAEARPLFRRTIPAAAFWLVTVVLAGLLALTVTRLRRDVHRQQPTGVITPAQLQETAAKRRALNEARELTRTGKYDEALRAYDAIITRYPNTVAAAEERTQVRQLLAQSTTPDAEVTKTAKKTRREKEVEAEATPAPEQKKPPSRWERVKKWFRGT
jgi:tRNA A-37 threonylcarbamoyl transferase component Bud32